MRKSPQRMSTKTIKIRMKCRRIMISSRRVFLNLFFEEIPDFEGDVFSGKEGALFFNRSKFIAPFQIA